MERINNQFLNPHAILENLQHISYPVQINLKENGILNKIIQEKIPFIYSSKTLPTFFFSAYKVAIIADVSSMI
jgi:hypothetical protein